MRPSASEEAEETTGVTATGSPKVRLLDDAPAPADEFEGRAHDSVARAIAELVRSEPGGRVIGLEGSWGSGKSTVVRLLCSHLEDAGPAGSADECLAVPFDAWAHQGDPLRRTFLEAIIDALVSKGWLPTADADAKKARLSGKTSKVHTHSTATLTLEGVMTSIAALLFPIGIALFGNRFHSQVPHRVALVIGFALLIAPIVVVAGFASITWVARRVQEGKRGLWLKALAKTPSFSFFARDQVSDTTTDTIEHGEPTSVEFEREFTAILKESLTEGRQLLIVLDNLDRVEAQNASALLATMQTFTRSSDYRTPVPWSTKVWTLIPYDPSGLERLWERPEEATATDQVDTDTDDDVMFGIEPVKHVAAAFLQKLFQIRFQTPPLVLSEWRDYLLRQLKLALPGVESDSSLRAVVRLRATYPSVERTGPVASEQPTPRQLKQFVNQIGAICRQRTDVPLTHVAYFVLLRRDGIDVAASLIAADRLPHPHLAHLFDTVSVRSDLAALHLGTPRDRAEQLLLSRPLEQALVAAEAETIRSLAAQSGFMAALDSLDIAVWAGGGGVELTRAVAVLGDADVLTSAEAEDWTNNVLVPLARRTKPWMLSGSETGRGLAILLDLTTTDEESLLKSVERISSGSPDEGAEVNPHLEGLAALADALTARARDVTNLRVKTKLPTEELAAGLAFFGQQTADPKSRAVLELTLKPTQVAQALVESTSSDTPENARLALETLESRLEDRVDVKALGSKCTETLRQQDPTSAEQLGAVLYFLDVASSESVDEVLTPLAEDGTLMHCFAFAHRSGWIPEAASASMLHIVAMPINKDPAQSREAPQGIQLLRQLLATPSSLEQVTAAQTAWLVEHSQEALNLLAEALSEDPSIAPWSNAQFKELHGQTKLRASPEEYTHHWTVLLAALGEEGFTEFTGGWLTDGANRQALIQASKEPYLALIALRAYAVTASLAAAESELQGWGAEVLRSATTELWAQALAQTEGGPLLQLALTLLGTTSFLETPPGLDDAVHVHARELQANGSGWTPPSETLLQFFQLLDASARAVFASQLCAGLEGQESVNAAFFNVYGDFLASEEEFRTHAKLPNFIERLVARDDWERVRWILDLAEEHRDTLQKKGRSAAIDNLKRKVSDKLKELGEDAPEELEALASRLKVS